MEYKVVISSAGLGSRLENLSKHVNKALVSVGNKPVISHIIDKIPYGVEIVIPVGYKKETVIDYLKFTHKERTITIVDVDHYQGEGSGLGYSLLKCEDILQCPFIFCSNDTIIKEQIPLQMKIGWDLHKNDYDIDKHRSIEYNPNTMSFLIS